MASKSCTVTFGDGTAATVEASTVNEAVCLTLKALRAVHDRDGMPRREAVLVRVADRPEPYRRRLNDVMTWLHSRAKTRQEHEMKLRLRTLLKRERQPEPDPMIIRHGRPDSRVSLVSFDDGTYREDNLLLDSPHGLRPGAHVWIWIEDAWREAIVREGQGTIFVRMVSGIDQ